MGDVWASQQLGVDAEQKVTIEYGIGGDIEMRVEDLLPLRKAIDGPLVVFGLEVIAGAPTWSSECEVSG